MYSQFQLPFPIILSLCLPIYYINIGTCWILGCNFEYACINLVLITPKILLTHRSYSTLYFLSSNLITGTLALIICLSFLNYSFFLESITPCNILMAFISSIYELVIILKSTSDDLVPNPFSHDPK